MSDYSLPNRELDLGLDLWDRIAFPYWWKVGVIVILLSMRETADLDNEQLHLAENPMVWSYHRLDYNWIVFVYIVVKVTKQR